MSGETIEEIKRQFKEELLQMEGKFNAVKAQLDKVREDNRSKKAAASSNDDFQQVLNNIEKECANATEGIKRMDEKWSSCLEGLSDQIHISDQYSRKNSLILRGYRYNIPNVNNCDFIQATASELNNLFPSLRGQVHPIHIDDAHPLGNKKTVIIKFSNRWVKHEILKCKRDLEGTGLTVTEHLTPHTQELIAASEKIVGLNNVWVHNTVVFARHKDTRFTIRTVRDIEFLKRNASLPEASQTDLAPIEKPAPESLIPSSGTDTLPPAGFIENDTTGTYCFPPTQHNDNYGNNYPNLYNSLFYRNVGTTKTSILRGRPSHNGRGRNMISRGRYNYRR